MSGKANRRPAEGAGGGAGLWAGRGGAPRPDSRWAGPHSPLRRGAALRARALRPAAACPPRPVSWRPGPGGPSGAAVGVSRGLGALGERGPQLQAGLLKDPGVRMGTHGAHDAIGGTGGGTPQRRDLSGVPRAGNEAPGRTCTRVTLLSQTNKPLRLPPPRSPSQGRRDPLVSLEASFSTATKFRSSHLGVFWRTCPGPRPGEPRRGGPGSPAAMAHFPGGVLTKTLHG